MLYLSEGVGHRFIVLSAEATVVYLCPTANTSEHGVNLLDPARGIAWPGDVEPVLSRKRRRRAFAGLGRSVGLLPDYVDCLAHAKHLRGR